MDATLTATTEPLPLLCLACGDTMGPVEGGWACPGCGTTSGAVTR